MNEQHALLEKAERRLLVAKKLVELSEFEASASQSYFAMHFAVRAALARRMSFPRTHDGARSEFGRLFVKSGALGAELLGYLDEARSYREKSDYSLVSQITADEARGALRGAELFVESVRGWLSTHDAGKGGEPDPAT